MEIKATLQKPYDESDRLNFIVVQNHQLGYKIAETQTELQAWGYTDEEWQEQERQRLDALTLTPADVERALYKDKGITPDQLKAQITNPEALIEFEYANDYFRGNPLINQIGALLGYTSEDLDYLFENKELPAKEEEENEN